MASNKYKIEVVWSPKDEMYVGICPEFPGLAVVCKSQIEAFEQAQLAVDDYIEIFEEDGIPLPEPRVAKEFSGQIRARFPKSLHAQASEMAADEGVSLNQFIVTAVQAKVSQEDIAKRIAGELVRPSHVIMINQISGWNERLTGNDTKQEFAETVDKTLVVSGDNLIVHNSELSN